jgi:hypothetical protein
MTRTLTALEAFSWGMFGDKGTLAAQMSGATSFSAPQRTYDEARKDLRDAIARGTVKARGFNRDMGLPSSTREVLPSDVFDRFPSLSVDAFGETSSKYPAAPLPIPEWYGIIFDEDEIRDLWPKLAPDLDDWMRKDAEKDPNVKKDTRIADCRRDTGCKVREAKAAYDRLPEGMRRGRGERIKPEAPLLSDVRKRP